MHETKSHLLEALILALDDHQALVSGHGLAHSALFLAAAKLDLQMHLYGISDEELRALCEALDRRPSLASGSAEADTPVDPCGDSGNVVSISEERRRRNAAGRALRARARGPVKSA